MTCRQLQDPHLPRFPPSGKGRHSSPWANSSKGSSLRFSQAPAAPGFGWRTWSWRNLTGCPPKNLAGNTDWRLRVLLTSNHPITYPFWAPKTSNLPYHYIGQIGFLIIIWFDILFESFCYFLCWWRTLSHAGWFRSLIQGSWWASWWSPPHRRGRSHRRSRGSARRRGAACSWCRSLPESLSFLQNLWWERNEKDAHQGLLQWVSQNLKGEEFLRVSRCQKFNFL